MSKTPTIEILSWTNQDPRESQLFNSWGVLYRFQTHVNNLGSTTTTLWRAVRANKEDRVAKLEWAPNGGLGRAIIGKNTFAMADLVNNQDGRGGSLDYRVFYGPDGLQYRWRSSSTNSDVLLQDPNGTVIAFFRPTRPTRYQFGDVYGELHFLPSEGAGTVMHPPIMDTITVSCMLYRFCKMWGL
ncbi:hypothetical protein BDN72DRAFT_366084 [Pluteus cervinus]|uniref:Uncharacterized protein n=1 Tax=Pluteus cervinus TaxID=181527 RepID=A0ACD3BDJ1_9AGAR|nr:hypothetical protein BDN72DRAFT_366084 [Pluteus cervinus]